MRSTLSLEKEWLEGLHNECLPRKDTFPAEIRESIDFSSRKVANPLFPLLVKWILEPAGIPQSSIIPVAYSIHLLEASSYIIDLLTSKEKKRGDPRFEKLLSGYGDAMCILCVDAMVTMSFQLLTELPQPEFLALSELLIERFGSHGVLGKKAGGDIDWKGDMVVVSFEASAKLAAFEPPVKRKLMNYGRKVYRYYRELESILGTPPGRELFRDRTGKYGYDGRCETETARGITNDMIRAARRFGADNEEFYTLAEGIVEIFTGVERSLSRLEEKNKTATQK